MTKPIPKSAFLFKEGLYINEYDKSVGKMAWTVWELYSAEGYQFYDLTQPENYDEEGNLVPENERVYAQYMIMRKDEKYVTENIISVPIQEGYEAH